ncbi:MAG TPA: ATP-binding protein [Terracidiphilus sp.]|jgi:two-component system sensor histidine kinase KdpD|nr:ATP-binding protein [Terracidiphilus sp.]
MDTDVDTGADTRAENVTQAPGLRVAALRAAGATALTLGAMLALSWLHANSTMAGMVFLVLVVWTATRAGKWLSLYIAGLCALSFDFFFLPPYSTFWLAGPPEWVEMLCFIASCVVVSRVAERERSQTLAARQRQADVERLYEMSQEMMLFENADRLIHELPRLINRIFALGGVALYVCEHERFFASSAGLPASVRANMQAMVQEVNPTMTSLAGYHTTVLMLGLRPVGALAWTPETLSREVAAAVSAQVSIAVARSIAIETSARVEAAREAERLRTALIDSLTHELRTPLTSIRAASTTLLGSGALVDAGQRDLVSIIDEEAARLDLLIGEAVQMAEIDANVVQLHLAPHHPRELLELAVEESRKPLSSHRVSITVDGTDDSPVWFDPQLLGRVLRHLLENAASYTPPGARITLSSRRTGDRLEFAVEDNGPGIDARDLPLIFDKFYRGKRSARGRKGSGMGLAITRAILTVHGGGIEAGNQQGGGARFRFWVPLVEKEPGSHA